MRLFWGISLVLFSPNWSPWVTKPVVWLETVVYEDSDDSNVLCCSLLIVMMLEDSDFVDSLLCGLCCWWWWLLPLQSKVWLFTFDKYWRLGHLFSVCVVLLCIYLLIILSSHIYIYIYWGILILRKVGFCLYVVKYNKISRRRIITLGVYRNNNLTKKN